MLGQLKTLWQHHRWALLAFAAAVCLTLFFAVRTVVFTLYWADPAHRQQTPEAWMTPRYIALSWGLEPQEVATALNVTMQTGKRPSLADIATSRGVPLSQVLAEVNALLARTKATK